MGVNSLPKTVSRQRRGCDLNPGPFAPESSTLSTRLPSHPGPYLAIYRLRYDMRRYLNARSKADMSQLNLPLETNNAHDTFEILWV